MASEPLVIPERYKHAHSTLVGRRTKVCTLRLTWTDEQIISFIEEIARLEAEVKFLKSAPCPFEAENATLKDEIEAVALALLGPGATYQPAQLALEVAALKAQADPTKQERVAVTRMGASEHVFVEFDGKIIYQFDDHEDEENDAEFHAKRYAAGLRLELEETK